MNIIWSSLVAIKCQDMPNKMTEARHTNNGRKKHDRILKHSIIVTYIVSHQVWCIELASSLRKTSCPFGVSLQFSGEKYTQQLFRTCISNESRKVKAKYIWREMKKNNRSNQSIPPFQNTCGKSCEVGFVNLTEQPYCSSFILQIWKRSIIYLYMWEW